LLGIAFGSFGCLGGRDEPARSTTVVTNGLIAYTDRDAQGRQQLFTIQPDGTGRSQLTFDGDSGLPSWFPDGSRILFTSMRTDAALQQRRPGA